MMLILAEAGLRLFKGRLLERDRVRLSDEKLGRPDILHVSLLNSLQTPAVYHGLKVLIHNYDGKIIRFRSDRRVPKRYERFRGLMEQLLKHKRVPPNAERPIVRISDERVEDIVKDKYVIGLTRRGRLEDPIDLLKRLDDNSALFVGMFPHGYFSEEIDALFNERIAISSRPLHARVVIARLVFAYEKSRGLL